MPIPPSYLVKLYSWLSNITELPLTNYNRFGNVTRSWNVVGYKQLRLSLRVPLLKPGKNKSYN